MKRNRVSRGVPQGGEFASQRRDESVIQITPFKNHRWIKSDLRFQPYLTEKDYQQVYKTEPDSGMFTPDGGSVEVWSGGSADGKPRMREDGGPSYVERSFNGYAKCMVWYTKDGSEDYVMKFSEDGNLRSEEWFNPTTDRMSGFIKHQTYWPNGKVRESEWYLNPNLSSWTVQPILKSYDENGKLVESITTRADGYPGTTTIKVNKKGDEIEEWKNENGEFERIDGAPAVIKTMADGSSEKLWFEKGVVTRNPLQGPAIIKKDKSGAETSKTYALGGREVFFGDPISE